MRVALTGGAYTARSLIANAQRCVNLYPEADPQGDAAPVPMTHYPTPGLRTLASGSGEVRGTYTASNDQLFAVIGNTLYYVSASWVLTAIGTIGTSAGIVSMMDNTLTMVLVDGSATGYTVDLPSHAFGTITDASFTGADRADYIDTFFLFNKPGTPQFISSLSLATTFDPLYFANKSGSPDLLSTLIVTHREIWLLGEKTTEIWINSGASDFPFQILAGAFIEHGCAAKWSVAKSSDSVFWLSQDIQGRSIVLRGSGYAASRISTHAIEFAISGYSVVSDARGYTYQQGGHTFYVLSFPTADATWVFDVTTALWHQRGVVDGAGVVHRHRGNCASFAYGTVVVGDYANGNLYAYDQSVSTEIGAPVTRVRTFPHMLNDGRRASYRRFVADIESAGSNDVASLRWSDDRGVTWGNPVTQGLGIAGTYTQPQWRNTGMARDRVFELSWTSQSALNGAFLDVEPMAS